MRLAIFDFDGTVLRGNSWQAFFWWAMRRWPSGAPTLLAALVARKLGALDAAGLRRVALRRLRGRPAIEIARLGEELFATRLRYRLRPAAQRAIDGARDAGLVPVLATAAFDFLVEPAARALGIQEVIATRLVFRDGACTGETEQPEPRGEHKLEAVRRRFAGAAVDWRQCAAFSDELEDLPLLCAVGSGTLVGCQPPPGRGASLQVVDWE